MMELFMDSNKISRCTKYVLTPLLCLFISGSFLLVSASKIYSKKRRHKHMHVRMYVYTYVRMYVCVWGGTF